MSGWASSARRGDSPCPRRGKKAGPRDALHWADDLGERGGAVRHVNKVVPLSKLEEETKALAEKIAEAISLTLKIGKGAFYAQVNLSDAHAYDIGNEVMVGNLFADDAKEGIRAFLEKRKPLWTGK